MSGENNYKIICITGANGFIGKNLSLFLKENGFDCVYKITRDTNDNDFKKYILDSDFIFNLAGVNRPKDEKEFSIGNIDFTKKIVNILIENNKNIPIMLSSSTQAELDNPYGKSKKDAEDVIKEYSKTTGAKSYIYRFANVFGKWSKPNYNSAVATFCYNISRDLPITINNKDSELNLIYIDDVCKEMLSILNGNEQQEIVKYNTTVGKLAETLKSFKDIRKNFYTPNLTGLNKYLYSTYLSFLDPNDFSYPLVMHKDDRGSFTEILKTLGDGQFSVNISKPGITKGGHYHHTKNEKFVVVSGKALIEFISLNPSDNKNETIKYEVSGDDIKVVDIPCGYSHTIKNIGDSDLVTVMWANEVFDEKEPDTFVYKYE